MPEIKITVPGVAAPKSIRIIMRNGHPSMGNNKKVRSWMDFVRDTVRVEMATLVYSGDTLIAKKVPVGVVLDVFLPWPKNTPKKIAATIAPHVDKPDGDNLQKPILDALSEARVWWDDAQVDKKFIQKWRCPRGEEHVEVVIVW